MIKGCHKNVVFLKNTGSELFDEAYFVVKPSVKTDIYHDIVTEAMEIAAGFCGERRKRHIRGFLLGLLLGAFIGAGITFLFI